MSRYVSEHTFKFGRVVARIVFPVLHSISHILQHRGPMIRRGYK